MTGKGGSTSAPPAIDHQREGKSLRVGMNRRVDKTPAWRVHGSSREGFMMKRHVWTVTWPRWWSEKPCQHEKSLRGPFMVPIIKGLMMNATRRPELGRPVGRIGRNGEQLPSSKGSWW